MAINWREHVKSALDEFLKNNPPIIGGGRRSLIVPEPRPEDERPPYKFEGPVPEGYTRAEIVRPDYDPNEKPTPRKGSFWVNVKHPDKPNHILERVFKGDIVDIPDAEFEKLMDRNWVRQPWTKKETKPQAA